ncbi:MAG: hypothetical protein LBG04_02375 [Holosporaceae bacterium]|nr:hypothetical protein [Holosporaceae bacterium]
MRKVILETVMLFGVVDAMEIPEGYGSIQRAAEPPVDARLLQEVQRQIAVQNGDRLHRRAPAKTDNFFENLEIIPEDSYEKMTPEERFDYLFPIYDRINGQVYSRRLIQEKFLRGITINPNGYRAVKEFIENKKS